MGAYKKPEYNGIVFDSIDEMQFYWWCEEAVDAGIIERFKYHPNAVQLCEKVKYNINKQLKTKVKVVEGHLLGAHEYTPDFILYGSNAILEKKYQDKSMVVIDVKPNYNLHKSSSIFSVNQKWIMQKYGLYVHRVKVKKFFKDNGIPSKLRLTKTGKVCKTWAGYNVV